MREVDSAPRLIRVGAVDPSGEHVADDLLGKIRRTPHRVCRVVGQSPYIGCADFSQHTEGLDVGVAVSQYAKGGYDFLAEVLVLVVSPYDQRVGTEFVQRPAADC